MICKRNLDMSVVVSLILAVCFALAGTVPAGLIHYPDPQKIRVAVYPLNDIGERTLDHEIASLIRRNLAEETHIEIIPVDTIRHTVYIIEPSLLWTEKKGVTPKGGILWDITPTIIEEVSVSLSADFSLYCNIIKEEDTWSVEIVISEGPQEGKMKSFTLAGLQERNVEEKITALSRDIHSWLMKESMLIFAEEEMRRFMGGMSTYSSVLKKIGGYVESYPVSIPLQSLLLDLYLQKEEINTEEIIREGRKLTDMIISASQDDIRYILSLSLDPFDAVATVHEKRGEWEKAIELRKKAIDVFPYKSRDHKLSIGKDYFIMASGLEEKGRLAKSREHFNDALAYLSPSSEYYEKTQDALIRLRYK
jgi:hypothetical protein